MEGTFHLLSLHLHLYLYHPDHHPEGKGYPEEEEPFVATSMEILHQATTTRARNTIRTNSVVDCLRSE